MKSSIIILFVVCLMGLSKFTYGHEDHHDHGHDHDHDHHHKHHVHKPRYPSTNVNLRTCASKLDYLCLGRLFTVIEAYKANVTNVINNLKDRINNRVGTFEAARDDLENSWQKSVLGSTRFLLQRIAQLAIIYHQRSDAFRVCLQNRQTEVVGNYRTTLLTRIRTCINNNKLNMTTSTAAITNLNSTAMAAADEVCNCVNNITTCPTKEQKTIAKTCAEAAAAKLNIELIQNRADVIYNQFDEYATSVYASLQSCLSNNVNLVADRDALLTRIDDCLTFP